MLVFTINGGTNYKILLWETFKSYTCGRCISLKVHFSKQKLLTSQKILQNITELENQHKINRKPDIKDKLEAEWNMIDGKRTNEGEAKNV